MKLAKFTLADGKQTPIHINPEHVAAVQPDGTRTKIVLALPNEVGSPMQILVDHSSDVVAHRLSLGFPR